MAMRVRRCHATRGCVPRIRLDPSRRPTPRPTTRRPHAPSFDAERALDARARARSTSRRRRCSALKARQSTTASSRAVQAILDVPRPRRRDGHGQERPRRPQDRRHARLHRHAGVLRAPGRGQPRRPRHDHRAATSCSRSPTRARATSSTAIVPVIKRLGVHADRDDRQRRLDAGARTPTSSSTPRSSRKPARSTSRPPPAPRRSWRSATRSRWRCSTRAASARTTSRARTRAARSAASC